MKRVCGGAAAVLALTAYAVPSAAQEAVAEATWWVNPGVKLSYTLGEGFTYGVELSVVNVPSIEDTDISTLLERGVFVGWGVVLNWDWTPATGLNKARLGAEWVGPGIGLEAGPTWISDANGSYFGFGVSPWAGAGVLPFYAYTAAFGRGENLHEVGAYLKYHLCVNGEDACGDGDGSDIDIDD